MADKSLLSAEVLQKLADDAVEYARFSETSNGNALPKELRAPGAIKASITGQRSGKTGITVYANPAIPMARAYEFGSGIHRQPGKRISKNQQPDGTILITPKNKKLLAFPWDKLDKRGRVSQMKVGQPGIKYVGDLPDGRAAFNYVNHPGVEAANRDEGYLRYGAKKSLQENVSAVGLDAALNILEHIKGSFAKRKFK